jgi:hypothetical protein
MMKGLQVLIFFTIIIIIKRRKEVIRGFFSRGGHLGSYVLVEAPPVNKVAMMSCYFFAPS